VRDERITAYGTGPGGWRSPSGRAEWGCERWSWSVDDPDELLEACRAPLFGFNTNEPRRALATRALARLAQDDRGPHPLALPRLEVPRGGDGDAPAGEWAGRWNVEIGVRNPFSFPVQAALALELRGGAFQTGELWPSFGLDPGAARRLALSIHGGSWSPIEDPLVLLRFAWRRGRTQETLVLDGPLERVRTLELGASAERLRLLGESPGDRPASMVVRRRGRELLAWVEDAGGLDDVHALVRLGSRVRRGRRAVRIRLPEEPDPRGLLFSVGFEGTVAGRAGSRLRRWCGGLPYGLGAGAPGRLLLTGRA
jgi:hypothetical protein